MKIVLNDRQKLDEIVFAKRNKSYGAYAIRASYNNTLLRALIIVSSSLVLFIGSAYILSRTKSEKPRDYFDGNTGAGVPVDLTPHDPPKPVQSSPSRAPRSNAISTLIRDTTQDNRPDVVNIDNNPTGRPDGDSNYVAPTTGIPGTGSVVATVTIEEKPLPPVIDPDVSPEFEGGLRALGDFIANNLVYPPVARDLGKEGTVHVTFIVNEKGMVESVNVLKGIGAGCDEEAARVVSKIPKFKHPGKKNGKEVKVIYNIPIKFKLK